MNAEIKSPLLENSEADEEKLSLPRLLAMLAPAFSWGCLATTMVLLTLPLESQRIDESIPGVDNIASIFLALFIFLGGVTELLCPVMGKMSDDSISIPNYWGRRIPFIMLGSLISGISMALMAVTSWFEIWILFTIFYTIFMTGMNVIYSSMIALIPDLVPKSQVGQANGILASQMVVGSVFGFAMFEGFLAVNNTIPNEEGVVKLSLAEMYVLYILVLLGTALISLFYTNERTDINAITEDENSSGSSLSKLFYVWKQAFIKIFALRGKELCAAYSVSRERHGDFFYVTVSRTLYYMGISVQSFFLYYIHDILRDHSALARESPQTLVSALAIVVQVAGVFLCYPAGYISDKCLSGRRKPLIYVFCGMLSAGTIALIFVRYVSQLYAIAIIWGLANGGYLTMETSLAVDSLAKIEEEHEEEVQAFDTENGYEEIKEKEGSAQLLGIWGVAAFVGVALGPLIGGPLLFLLGHLSEDDMDDKFDDDYVGGQEYSLLGYIVVFSASALYFIGAAYSLKWVKNCD